MVGSPKKPAVFGNDLESKMCSVFSRGLIRTWGFTTTILHEKFGRRHKIFGLEDRNEFIFRFVYFFEVFLLYLEEEDDDCGCDDEDCEDCGEEEE